MIIDNSLPFYSKTIPFIKDNLLIYWNDLDNSDVFWKLIKEKLHVENWTQLEIKDIGLFERKKIEEIVNLNYLISPQELPFIKQLSLEKLKLAKLENLTSLHLAVLIQSLDWVEVAAQIHPINAICLKGTTPLINAFQSGNKAIVHFLLQNGKMDPALTPYENSFLLELAAEYGLFSIVKWLIFKGAEDLNHSALKKAIAKGHQNIVFFLTEHFWKINFRNTPFKSAMYSAILEEKKEIISFLVENGFNINAVFKTKTFLGWAVFYKKISIVKHLLKIGADVAFEDSYGQSPLEIAFNSNSKEMIELLLEIPNIDLANPNKSPLLLAIKRNMTSIVHLLLKKGLIEKIKDVYPFLKFAIYNGNLEMVNLFLENRELSHKALKHEKGGLLFIAAADANHLEIAKRLYEFGIDINLTNEYGETALFIAVKKRNQKIVEFLLEKEEVDLGIINIHGETLLHNACRQKNPHLVKELLEKGFKPINQINKEGKNAMHVICNPWQLYENPTEITIPFIEIISLLLKYGADPSIPALYEDHSALRLACVDTPFYYALYLDLNDLFHEMWKSHGKHLNAKIKESLLHVAVERGKIHFVKFLLENKVNVNSSIFESTLIKKAFLYNHIEIVKLLIDFGADLNHEDFYGETPLHAAVRHGNVEIVRLLIAKGGNVHAQSKKGYDVLATASFYNQTACIAFLLGRGETEVNARLAIKPAIERNNDEAICCLINFIFNQRFERKKNQSILLQVIKKGMGFIARFLIHSKMNPNLVDLRGKSLLHYASEKGLKATVKTAIAYKANLDLRDENGCTPLHYAVLHKQSKIASILMEAGSNIHCRDAKGKSLVHIAAEGGNEEIFFLLAKNGCNLTIEDDLGNSPIIYACEKGWIEIISIILKICPKQIEATDRLGNSLLHIAAFYEQERVLEYLIEKGANRRLRNKMNVLSFHLACKNKNKFTTNLLMDHVDLTTSTQKGLLPIHYAASGNNVELVQLLLKFNSINAKTSLNETPLFFAIASGNCEMTEFLIQNGANIESVNFHGITPLLLAANCGREQIVQVLLNKGSNSKCVDFRGRNFFHCAVYGGLIQIVRHLLDENPQIINQLMNDGKSALHLAAFKGHKEIAELLIEKGANPFHITHQGIAVLHSAAENGQVEIIKLLVKQGADIGLADQKGMTPLHYAVRLGKKQVVKYILRHHASEAIKKMENGNLPIHLAAEYGHHELISYFDPKILIKENTEGLTPIHLASKFGHLNVIQRLIVHGVNINLQTTETRLTPLHIAIKYGNEKVFNFLLDNACLNSKDKFENTPLHYAVQFKKLEKALLLIKKGCQVNKFNEEGLNPFHCAIIIGDIKFIEALEPLYENPYKMVTLKGNYPLHHAIIQNNLDLVKYLIEKKNVDPNQKNLENKTPLHFAIEISQKIVKELISCGGDIHVRDIKGNKPIHIAALTNKFEIIRKLTEGNNCFYNLNTVNFKGHTPLHFAVIANQINSVRFLKSLKAESKEDHYGITPMALAVNLQFEKMIEVLKTDYPSEFHRSTEYYLRKNLWHCITPPLKGAYLIKKSGSKENYVEYAGASAHYFINEIANSIESFASLFPEHLNLEKAEIIRTSLTKSINLYEHHKAGKPLFILNGFKKHHVMLFIWKTWLCICNRGAEAEKNVDVFSFDKNLPLKEILNEIIYSYDETQENFRQFFYDKLPKKLNFVKGNFEILLEKYFSKYPQQEEGSCAYTSTEMAMGPYFVFDTLFENSMHVESIKIGIKRHHDWQAFMQSRAFQKMVSHSLISDYEPDVNLIEESLAYLKTRKLDGRICSLISKTESDWREGGHSPLPPGQIDWLWKGSQQVFNNLAPNDKEVFERLDLLKEEGIIFNPNKIFGKVEGGTCSAMALDFAAKALQMLSQLGNNPSIECYRDCMRLFGREFRRSNKAMRSIQAAFNTIEVLKDKHEIDFSRAKIQSLANYFSLKIVYSTNELVITDKQIRQKLKSELAKMPIGLYIVRQILPSENEKLEVIGHSMIYIKLKNTGFFYEMNQGLRDLFEKDHVKEIMLCLKKVYFEHGPTHIHFYKLTHESLKSY